MKVSAWPETVTRTLRIREETLVWVVPWMTVVMLLLQDCQWSPTLVWRGGVHIQLVRMNHRVFWLTQRKIEGHTGGLRRGLQRCVAYFDPGR